MSMPRATDRGRPGLAVYAALVAVSAWGGVVGLATGALDMGNDLNHRLPFHSPAFGAFALENNIDNGPVSDGDTTGVTLHHSFAYVVVLFAVALLAVSFGAKVQHGVRWAAIPLVLVVVQFLLAYAAYSAAIVGVLHGLNALAIFAVALLAGRRVPKAAPVAEPSAAEEAPV